MYIYIYYTYLSFHSKAHACECPELEFGLYKILFYFWAFVHESIQFFPHAPFVQAAHPTPSSPTRLRNIMFPPDPSFCNIYNTILAMAISCKGQVAVHLSG